MKNAALYLAIAVLAAACASKETQTEAPITDKSTAAPSTSGSTGSTTRPSTASTMPSGNPLKEGTLAKRSVYFDFDSNVVKDEYRGLVQAHSRYIADHRSQHVRIEGNCDERGSREYNIALGQRRADAVKRMMLLDGATDQQIETVSFGKEKPRNGGHDEGAWAENRRDDFVYAGE
jgi:peptidoglycan-associated lipoprotein